ncbi:MAG TPA: ribokinase [Ktedonobacter sp.]|nr:ribokinase [Ktedonobacter sp.]
MHQSDILVVGSLNMDQIVRVPRLPMHGETLLAPDAIQLVSGGKGANQAVAISRLGASVRMAGRVGDDPFGEHMLSAIQHDDVDTSLIVVDKENASGAAFVFLLPDGNNAIVVAPGANMRVGMDEVQMERIREALHQVKALVLQMEIPVETVQLLVREAHEMGVRVVLNVAPAHPLPREVLQKVSVLVVNESEAMTLSGQRVESIEDARIVGEVLHRYGIAVVVITLGARGAVLVISDETGMHHIYQAAPRVQVVDTTAAGDCFCGALTVAFIEGQTPKNALRFAVNASALKVTRFGAQSGLPTRADVLAAYPL